MNRPRWMYYGTGELRARTALLGGIRPRAADGAHDAEGRIESNPELVYLTDSYPGVTAMRMAQEGRLAVVEVDVKRLTVANFRPDEDVMEQGSREWPGWEGVPEDADVHARLRYFRSQGDRLRGFWRETVRLMGSAGYKGTVPARAISRVAFFDAALRPEMAVNFQDAGINVENYAGLRLRHRTLTRWLFEPVRLERIYQTIADINAYGEMELVAQLLDHSGVAWWRGLLLDRTGLEVMDNPGHMKGGGR